MNAENPDLAALQAQLAAQQLAALIAHTQAVEEWTLELTKRVSQLEHLIEPDLPNFATLPAIGAATVFSS